MTGRLDREHVAGPEVLVVGGGPAGSTVATLLARRGREVVLLDRARFPRPKACGECINPGGVALLDRLGLLPAVRELPSSRIEGWELVTGRGDRASARFGPEVGAGLAVTRGRLDEALLAVARRAGVRVEEGVTARAAEAGGSPTLRVVERDGRLGLRSAKVLVGADGLQSVVARALGGPVRPPRVRKVSLTARLRIASTAPTTDPVLPTRSGRLVLTDEGTLGLAPVGPGEWNATLVVDAAERGREIAADAEAFLCARLDRHAAGWRDRIRIAGGPWASGPFDRPRGRVAGGGVVLVGDAAGYFDPLTGQGIYRALRSAELAASHIDTALERGRPSEADLPGYARALDEAFSPGRRVQRVIDEVVGRRWSRRLAVARLDRVPGALGALIRVTGDARPWSTLVGVPALRALTLGR